MRSESSTTKSFIYGMAIFVTVMMIFELAARMAELVKPPSDLVSTIETPKRDGSFRIFVYGGSTAQGQPTLEYGFVPQLEFWLRKTHPNKSLEIYNFAGAGRTSAYARRKVTQSISLEPDLLIVLSGHNEFLYRETEGVPNRIVENFALTRSLDRKLKRAMTSFAAESIATSSYQAYDRTSKLFKDKVQAYADNLNNIIETARDHETPVILVTAPSNISDWPPAYQGSANDTARQVQDKLVQEIDDLLDVGESRRAIESIRGQLAANPDDSLLFYLLGRSYAAANDYDQARSYFTRAKDLDPIPWRALTGFNQLMRELADSNGVYLVDAAESFEQKADHGLVGFSLIIDNCHPTPLGNSIIARDILHVMQRNSFFIENKEAAEHNLTSIDHSPEHFVSETTTPNTRRTLEFAQVMASAKYSMKTPFHNNNASRMYLYKALEIDASNWEIWVNLATLALLDNRIEEGRRQLKKAIELRGTPIDENDRKHAPYLKEALAQSGIDLAEI